MLLEKNSKDKCEGENKMLKNIWKINGTLREVVMRKQTSTYTT